MRNARAPKHSKTRLCMINNTTIRPTTSFLEHARRQDFLLVLGIDRSIIRRRGESLVPSERWE